uniref:Uncharacterized protein n=1 Tax=Urocitellus parryii TaxID=9999 RepID=A0A8D2HIQ0_UROPR
MVSFFTDVGRFFSFLMNSKSCFTFPLLFLNIPFNTFLYFIIPCVLVLAVAAVIFYFVYRTIFKLSNEVELTSNRINVKK